MRAAQVILLVYLPLSVAARVGTAKNGAIQQAHWNHEERRYWASFLDQREMGAIKGTFMSLSPEPTQQPTSRPTSSPTTALPTTLPTLEPTERPSPSPTSPPTASPSDPPTKSPTASPSSTPSATPTSSPSEPPSLTPTVSPSSEPTFSPSESPSRMPTVSPSAEPTPVPSVSPSGLPSGSPTVTPSCSPSTTPSISPTAAPSTIPSEVPTAMPSATPTASPSKSPSSSPSSIPTQPPTQDPTAVPTTSTPSAIPSSPPTPAPSQSFSPTTVPTQTSLPTSQPTGTPTTVEPTASDMPSSSPTVFCAPDCTLLQGGLPAEGDTIFGRIRRNDTVASTCEGPNIFPGQFGNIQRRFESVGPFCNPEPDEEVCVTVYWDFGTCIEKGDVQVHPVAYTQLNTSDFAQGYLGDIGASNNTAAQFSFNLPGSGTFFLIFQQIFPGTLGIGCQYEFLVDFDNCDEDLLAFPQPDPFEVGGHNLDPAVPERATPPHQ